MSHTHLQNSKRHTHAVRAQTSNLTAAHKRFACDTHIYVMRGIRARKCCHASPVLNTHDARMAITNTSHAPSGEAASAPGVLLPLIILGKLSRIHWANAPGTLSSGGMSAVAAGLTPNVLLAAHASTSKRKRMSVRRAARWCEREEHGRAYNASGTRGEPVSSAYVVRPTGG